MAGEKQKNRKKEESNIPCKMTILACTVAIV